MATRAYRRDKNGRFAGSGGGGGGTFVTYGKAGGFANSAFRARVAASRGASLQKPPSASQRASRSRSLGATVGAKARSAATSNAGRTARAVGRGALNVAVTQAAVNAVGRGFGQPEARLGSISRTILFASGASHSLQNSRPKNPAGRRVKR